MNWTTRENQQLIQAILSLKTEDETKRFLRDLMTEGEIDEFSRRLQVAAMLSQKVSYTQIESKTGMSSTTIARIAKWLNGKEGGYKTILERIHHHSAQTRRGLS